jgi:hypothetical protein
MRPGLRTLALTTHITLSVGWIGAVLAYLVLVVAAMTRADAQTLRAAWLAMELIGWYLIVPLALASLLTGLVMSLDTTLGARGGDPRRRPGRAVRDPAPHRRWPAAPLTVLSSVGGLRA